MPFVNFKITNEGVTLEKKAELIKGARTSTRSPFSSAAAICLKNMDTIFDTVDEAMEFFNDRCGEFVGYYA